MELPPGTFSTPEKRRPSASYLSPLIEDHGFAAPLDENSLESPDMWGESPDQSAFSTQGSPWRSNNFGSKLGQSRSLPSLRGTWYSHSPHSSTWYSSGSNRTTSQSNRTLWSPLGSTWREREKDDCGVPVRKNADEGNAFIHGCIPRWGKIHTRKAKALEHELTWCYYRMRRHALHPQREPVGDPHMPNEHVVEPMRSGEKFKFQFWRDLKPPFMIGAMRRDQEDAATKHPDGDLFHVSYSCGLDYVGERLWNEKCEGGTYDNKIKGVASIRIPDGYPQVSGITIVSWGRPSLNENSPTDPNGDPLEDGFIDPNKWMPISAELGLRSDMPRFAACREATRKAHAGVRARRQKAVEVAPLQKLLLGPHGATLPRLASATHKDKKEGGGEWKGASEMSPGSPDGNAEGATPSPKKTRQHCVFTAAAGFVRYAG